MPVTQAPQSKGTITVDQEAWLRDRLIDLVNTCEAIKKTSGVSANSCMIEKALEGAIEGQALEILLILGLEPAYTVLPKRSWWVSDSKHRNTVQPFVSLPQSKERSEV